MQIRFASVLPWWIVVAIAILGSIIIVLWYWRESRQTGASRGLLLAALRGLVFFLMITMLLRPSLEYSWTDGELSRLRIVVDTSRSMQTMDEPSLDAPNVLVPRISRVTQGLMNPRFGQESLLDRLARQHRVELLDLEGRLIWDSELTPSISADWKFLANQTKTPLGELLLSQIRENGNIDNTLDAPRNSRQQLDALVLISDGQSNGLMDPIDILSQNTDLKFPIYTVAAGQPEEPVDLGILSANVSAKVRKEDRLRGSIRIKEECPEGTKYRVQIKNNGVSLYEEELVVVTRGIRDYAFDFPAEEAFELAKSRTQGDEENRRAIPIDLECEIVATPELVELTLANNNRMSSTWGVTRENRILILDPRGRWETRYIRNALARDPNWDLESRLGFLEFEKDFLLNNKDALIPFDLVILTNEAAKSLDDDQSQWIADFVGKTGGGLIWIDSSRSDIDLTEIWRTLLPFRKDATSEVVHIPNKWDTKGSLRLAVNAESEPALQLASDETNLNVWQRLAGPRSAIIRKLKPGSEVLIEFKATKDSPNAPQTTEEWHPYMTTSRFGQGRVLAMASDESWRWRYEVADLYHQRFWNQISNWCMRPPFAVSDDFLALDAGNRVYSLLDSVVVRAKLFDDKRLPIENGNVKAVLSQDGVAMARIDLMEQSESGGVYQGVYRELSALSEIGTFDPSKEVTVSIEASGVPLEALKTTTSFQLDPSIDIESSKLACNTERLETIANKSEARCLKLASLDQIEELLSIHTRGIRRLERVSLAESYLWLSAVMTVLALEWILRKRFGLV